MTQDTCVTVLCRQVCQDVSIVVSLSCVTRCVRMSAMEQFTLMATKCCAGQRPLLFFITLLFTVLGVSSATFKRHFPPPQPVQPVNTGCLHIITVIIIKLQPPPSPTPCPQEPKCTADQLYILHEVAQSSIVTSCILRQVFSDSLVKLAKEISAIFCTLVGASQFLYPLLWCCRIRQRSGLITSVVVL